MQVFRHIGAALLLPHTPIGSSVMAQKVHA
jgi:hypothetical protein